MKPKTNDIILTCVLAIFLFVFSFWAWLKPADAASAVERKQLASFPKITWRALMNKDFMEDFETYTLDQFPLRETFAKVKAGVNLYLLRTKTNLRGDHRYYIHDGYLSEMNHTIHQNSLDHVANCLQSIYDRNLKDRDVQIYFSVIPDKNYVMAKSAGIPSLDYNELLDTMREKTSYMEYIDLFDLLSLEDYYKTDTHWRQEKIIDVANRLAAKMDVPLRGQYEEHLLEKPFRGVYYGQSGIPGIKEEPLIYLTNDTLSACSVSTYDKEGKRVEMSLYDMEKAHGHDLYETFLSGSLGYIEIQNPNADSDKELVIFRDSFGSSLAPLLAEGYAKMTVLDTRYLNSSLIDRYVTFDRQDVLFLYSTLVLNNGLNLT